MEKESSKNGKFLKTIGIIEIIIALIIVVFLIFLAISNKSKDKDVGDLSDFEQVGLYNYLENYFIDYNILDAASNDGDEKLDDLEKDIIVLENYFQKNNKNQMTEEKFRENYSFWFGENQAESILEAELANKNYEYDVGNNMFTKADTLEESLKLDRAYEVDSIKQEDNQYIVEFSVFEKNPIGDKENIGKAYLFLRVQDGRYIITNFYTHI